MARNDTPAKNVKLVPSLLDRLIDGDPKSTAADRPLSEAQVLADLKRGLLRDLENLLNTRCHVEQIPWDDPVLGQSIVTYGLPDVSGTKYASENDRNRLRQRMRHVIETFEPRLSDVVVELRDADLEHPDRLLRFRINAVLHAEPYVESLVFDTTVESDSGDIVVEEGR